MVLGLVNAHRDGLENTFSRIFAESAEASVYNIHGDTVVFLAEAL